MRRAVVLLLLSTTCASAQTHPCAKDAIARAKPLLELHHEGKLEKEGRSATR